MRLSSYRDLIVWQKSISLAKIIYELTAQLPRSEMYGLSSQMRRSTVSIPSNIAEGYRRKSGAEFVQFIRIADGSASELETQILLTKELYPFINTEPALALLSEVQKMLYGMKRSLKERQRI